MIERKPEDIRRAIDGELSGVSSDPFLYQRVLNIAKEPQTRRRSRRMTVALVVLAVLMLSTAVAVATNWTSVQWFLTNRRLTPVDVDTAAITHPSSQNHDSEWLNVTVMDAYWYDYGDDGKLAVTMHLDVKDPDVAFCLDTDIGTDGESDDLIWWRGSIIPVIEWLDGRACITASPGSGGAPQPALVNGEKCLVGYDHIQEEQGITLILELQKVPDLSQGATVSIPLWAVRRVPDETNTWLEFTDEQELITLVFELPPMRKGPPFSFDDYE
ncbi:MAG: hypothetical protein J1E43_03710 [Christensenellaceae bacterium]|nr:hypothetical protein [Christensenellaceae bacterium]